MFAQTRGQVAIQLNDVQMPKTLYQGLRERGQARTDFNHRLTRHRRYGVDNTFDDVGVGQKVLTEALAGDVFQRRLTLLRWVAVFNVGAPTHFLSPLFVGLFKFALAHHISGAFAKFTLTDGCIAASEDLN